MVFDLRPSRQAAAHKDATTLRVFSLSVQLDYLSAESFVGIDGPFRNRRPYDGLRGFFLLVKARSRLRR
jgi:hypothetical protein